MNDFKVGDKVEDSCNKAIGEILQLYWNFDNEECAFIKWSDGVRTWHNGCPLNDYSLRYYKEPLKYSTGEEPRVGDIVYHSNFKSVGEVIDVLEEGVTVDNFTIGLRDTWGLMDSVKLRKRRGY